MKPKLILLLQRLMGWRLSAIVMFCIVLAVEVIVSVMDLILKGEITADNLLTGVVAAGIVAPPSIAVLSYLLQELSRQQQEVLSNSVDRAEARLKVALQSTDEGILMVAQDGKLLSTNQRFLELWRVPQELADAGQDEPLLAYVLDQLADPEEFLTQVRRLYGSNEEARDTLCFKDGRVFARYTRPLSMGSEPGRIWCFKDITEQAHTQTALAEREEIFRTIVTQANDAITLIDTETLGFVEFNDAACEALGYTRDEFARLGAPDIQAEMDVEALRRHLPSVIGEGVRNFETRHRHKDGSLRHVLVSLRAIELHGHVYMVGTWSDITERKQSESALAESRNLLQTIIDTAPMRVFWKDRDLRYLGCNPAFAKDGGMAHATDVVGKDDYQMAWADQAELYRADDRAVMESGVAKLYYEEPQTTPDGQEIWLRTSKVPLRNHDNETIGLLGIYEDVTERRRVEQRLSMAIEVTQVVFWELDFVNDRLMFDRIMLPILGLEADDAPDSLHSWIERVHPDDRMLFQARVELAMQPGDPVFDFEYRMPSKAGPCQWIHTRGRIVQRGVGGQPTFAVGTSMNITARKQIEEFMRISEERSRNLASMLRLMCDNVPDMIWAKDLENRYLFTNKAICEQLLNATDTEEPSGKTDMFFAQRERASHPDKPQWHTFGELCQDTDTITLDRGRSSVFEEFGNIKGQLLFLDVHKAPFFNEKGEVIGTVGSARDITERKKADEKLHLAASVFTHAREGIMITDADGAIIDVNDTFTRITGYSRAEALGQNPRMLSSGLQGQEFYVAMWRDLTENGHWSGEIWNRRKNGDLYTEMQTISGVRDAQGNIRQYVALFSDITALKEHEKQLEHIAHYDALTGLPNRVLLADRLRQGMAQAQRRAQPLAVAYLDLDGFKAINDKHGHETGDQLLMSVATRMKQTLREGDTLARLGGDEFVAVLLDLADIEASVPMLTRLLDAAAEPVHLNDLVLQVSASLGVTFYPQVEDVDADLLLRQADQSMYQAKLAGKNRYHVFDAEHDRSVRGHHESLDRIRHALAEREFVLHYQPKVNMRTGVVIGAEALIRWQHPEKGLLPPGVFLPVIEDHPLAVELGEWVIDTALTQMEMWHAAGLDLPVSVNVGARQLQQTDFVARLREILVAHPTVRPGDLELEVLETSALEDVAQVSQVIETCREIGVSFALDDFGTGYSSLTYLKRLPVTLLKIDQSFVRDMLDDPEDLAILEGVIGLSTAFRRQVIAEGVETLAHGEMLLRLGCEQAQGYGIARPMPAAELPGWSAAWRPDPAWGNSPSVSRDEMPLLFAGACAGRRAAGEAG